MAKKLNDPLAKFTVDKGYLCRVDERGMLNYDYPEGEVLYVKHPKVYQQLIQLKKDNNLAHTIVPTFPSMEMMPHDLKLEGTTCGIYSTKIAIPYSK